MAAATTTPPTINTNTGVVYPTANGQRLVYDTGNIVDVLRNSQSDITIVGGHRGYWREDMVPENSLRAIQRASDNNLEMIEIDIKMSRDGVPVLSHDFTLGRVTVGGGYDLVSATTSGTLQGYRLKDKNGTATPDHLPTLEQALDYIHDHRIAIVVALDIKDRNAALACWELVKRKQNAWNNPAYNWVIFKINATVYPFPVDMVYEFKGMLTPTDPNNPAKPWKKGFYYDKLLYMPVYATNMVDKLDCLDSQRRFKAQPFCVGLEINYKQAGGILVEQMNDIHDEAVNQKRYRTKAIFNAIPDAGGDRFWKANGYQTYRLQDIYYTAKNGKRDTDDQRGSWQFLTQENFHMIVTDEPISLANTYLKGKNLRNTSRFRPHPDGVNDEVDPHGASPNSDSTAAQTARLGAQSMTSRPTLSRTPGAYPNPTQGNLTVSLNQATEGMVQFRVTDQLGRTVLTQERKLPAGEQQVDLPNLRAAGAKPGLYLLQVTPGNGQPRQTMKVQVN